MHLVSQGEKRAVLSHLLKSGPNAQTLVFTRTKHGANRLAEQLTHDGLQCAAIHGNKSQSARTRALEDFKEYKVQVLVATDIAARGLDITELPQVVNYELPHVPEDYVHRIGRTRSRRRHGPGACRWRRTTSVIASARSSACSAARSTCSRSIARRFRVRRAKAGRANRVTSIRARSSSVTPSRRASVIARARVRARVKAPADRRTAGRAAVRRRPKPRSYGSQA